MNDESRIIQQYSIHCGHFLTCTHCQNWLQAELRAQLRSSREQIRFLQSCIRILNRTIADLRARLLRVESHWDAEARAEDLINRNAAGRFYDSEPSEVDSLCDDSTHTFLGGDDAM